MWVDNKHQASACHVNLSVHLIDGIVSEVLGVELEVLVALRVVVLLGPLDVAPEHVHGEAIVGKVPVSLHEHLS